MSYAQDAVISVFFGVLPSVFEAKLNALCGLLDEEQDAQYFVINGLLHTMTILGRRVSTQPTELLSGGGSLKWSMTTPTGKAMLVNPHSWGESA